MSKNVIIIFFLLTFVDEVRFLGQYSINLINKIIMKLVINNYQYQSLK